jgi:SAM-dependent methyltransferase
MSKFIHRTAANGFEAACDSYQRSRPDYPLAVIDLICTTNTDMQNKTIVDLAAGTGKLTRLLSLTGAKKNIAFEPVKGMREKLYSIPDITVVNGIAEDIPIEDEGVDIVTVGQAFHWFNGQQALKEIYRILKPSGKLYLFWQLRDVERCPWLGMMNKIIDQWQPLGHPHYQTMKWQDAFNNTSSIFSPLIYEQVSHEQYVAIDILLDRILSSSFISCLSEDDRRIALDDVITMINHHPETVGRTELLVPYQTHIYWCERLCL